MSIILLDKETIEKIAAGEVIESPYSVVKELIENSIDAGATSITLEIKKGGKSYIRVTDNGEGIKAEEIPLAFTSHATSKIKDFSDLYKIYSLGFRGEALASIKACADITLVSKSKEEDLGKIAHFSGNKLVDMESIATNVGTSIEVFDLFKDLPVRRKFLKSDLVEGNRISRLMYSLALGYDNISFKYIKDGRVEFLQRAGAPLKEKIPGLLDSGFKDNLLEISGKDDIYKISGYISSPNYYRGNRSFEYLFVNGRLVESPSITKTIEASYKSLIPPSRFPGFFIFIETHPKNLDINIHPNKRTIKFSYEDDLLSLLERGLEESLGQNKAPKKIEVDKKEKKQNIFYNPYQNLLDNYNPPKEELEKKVAETPSFFKGNFFESGEVKKDKAGEGKAKEESLEKIDPDRLTYLTTFFKKYSLFSYGERILILNHTRADQKIKFEDFKRAFQRREVAGQVLLQPKILRLKDPELNAFKEKKDLFENLGFDIDYFGDDSIIIRALPDIFKDSPNLSFFYDILDLDFSEDNNVVLAKINDLIRGISFRKGNPINEGEAYAIMNRILSFENPYKTYDGKNTLVFLEEKELEKYFDR